MKEYLKKIDVKILLVCLAVSFSACSDANTPTSGGGENPPDTTKTHAQVPKLKTMEVNNITTTSAESGGNITADGSSSISARGVCWDTSRTPDLDGNCRKATAFSGSGKFSLKLDGLKDSTIYYVRAYAKNDAGVGYGNEISFTTDAANLADVEVKQKYVPAVYSAFISAEVHSGNGYPVTERGFCWSKNPEPDYQNSDTVKADNSEEFLREIKGLEPGSAYYVRAYAVTEKGVGYSEQLSIRTLNDGDITYTLHKKANPTSKEEQIYTRIKEAMEGATYYYENYTSITKDLDIYYKSSVSTANGSINGRINFGPKAIYQDIGTALHEMAHTVGVGTTNWWSQQIVSGKYQGTQANFVLDFITQGESSQLKGGDIHFWPFGFNKANKTGEESSYIKNALIIQGMKQDGLPIN